MFIRDELDAMREMLRHGGGDMAQLRHKIAADDALSRLDCHRNPFTVRHTEQKIEGMVRPGAILPLVRNCRWLLDDISNIAAHQGQAQEAIFQHALELDDARARKSRQRGDHAAAKAAFGPMHEVTARAARIRPAMDQILNHVVFGAQLFRAAAVWRGGKKRFRLLSGDAGTGPAETTPAG